jgi:hypothetical protein
MKLSDDTPITFTYQTIYDLVGWLRETFVEVNGRMFDELLSVGTITFKSAYSDAEYTLKIERI